MPSTTHIYEDSAPYAIQHTEVTTTMEIYNAALANATTVIFVVIDGFIISCWYSKYANTILCKHVGVYNWSSHK